MGAGYTGMALLSYFNSTTHEIYITTTNIERIEELKPLGKKVLLLDSTSEESLRDLIQACDGIIVLVAPKNSEKYEETYLNTAKLISSMLTIRKTPFYILYTSSTSVYDGTLESAKEDAILNPPSVTGKILLETEQVYLNSRAKCCILRLGGIYGPKRELIERARRLSGKEMPGTGDECTNNIHLNDIVNSIVFCLDNALTGIYNLVNDDHPTRKELYNELSKEANIPPPTWKGIGKKGGYKVSNEKIKSKGFYLKSPLINSN
jgi:nucleoside-diphosphate-sugar epimerase